MLVTFCTASDLNHGPAELQKSYMILMAFWEPGVLALQLA